MKNYHTEYNLSEIFIWPTCTCIYTVYDILAISLLIRGALFIMSCNTHLIGICKTL